MRAREREGEYAQMREWAKNTSGRTPKNVSTDCLLEEELYARITFWILIYGPELPINKTSE